MIKPKKTQLKGEINQLKYRLIEATLTNQHKEGKFASLLANLGGVGKLAINQYPTLLKILLIPPRIANKLTLRSSPRK